VRDKQTVQQDDEADEMNQDVDKLSVSVYVNLNSDAQLQTFPNLLISTSFLLTLSYFLSSNNSIAISRSHFTVQKHGGQTKKQTSDFFASPAEAKSEPHHTLHHDKGVRTIFASRFFLNSTYSECPKAQKKWGKRTSALKLP